MRPVGFPRSGGGTEARSLHTIHAALEDQFKCFLHSSGGAYRSYMDELLGDGIFNADGELWRKQRKTTRFEFASKNLRDFSAIVFREYSLKLSGILSQASKAGKVVDMQEM